MYKEVHIIPIERDQAILTFLRVHGLSSKELGTVA